MDEKVLIKSEVNNKTKHILAIITACLFIISAILCLALLLITEEEYGYFNSYTINGFEAVFEGYEEYVSLFVLFCLALVAGIVSLIIYFALSRCSLTITDKNVRGKALFGKEVILPLHMVSAYSTRKFLSTIAVATSSGITKFALIKNYIEIGNELSHLINERQDKTKTVTEAPTKNSTADELIKYKNLLDSGIITQEEFDAKKKQLLGL